MCPLNVCPLNVVGTSESPAVKVLADVWKNVAAVEREMLDGIALAALLERAKGRDEQMYHI
jgi:hypothetical protein